MKQTVLSVVLAALVISYGWKAMPVLLVGLILFWFLRLAKKYI